MPATPAPKSKKPKLSGYVPVRFTAVETWTHDICAWESVTRIKHHTVQEWINYCKPAKQEGEP